MRKGTKYATAAAAALLGLGAVSTSASANIVKSTGGPAFSGLSASGSGHVFTLTGGGGTVVMSCGSASFGSINGAGNMNASFAPAYTGCSIDISGVQCAIAISTPGTWTLSQGAAKTGGWGASFTLGTAAKIEIDDPACGFTPADCTISIPTQSVTGPSVLAANNAGSTAVKLSGTVTGISWSSATPNCGIGSSGATATYSINGTGGIAINGIKLT